MYLDIILCSVHAVLFKKYIERHFYFKSIITLKYAINAILLVSEPLTYESCSLFMFIYFIF